MIFGVCIFSEAVRLPNFHYCIGHCQAVSIQDFARDGNECAVQPRQSEIGLIKVFETNLKERSDRLRCCQAPSLDRSWPLVHGCFSIGVSSRPRNTISNLNPSASS